MTSQTKMLQILIDGQKSIRNDIEGLKKHTDQGFKNVNDRLDKIGRSVASLEDDTPTNDEFDKQEKRVNKVEKKLQIQTSLNT